MSILQRIKHINSDAASANAIIKPTADIFLDGEFIINYNAINPTLFVRDSAGAVREFPVREAVQTMIDALKGGALPNVSGYRSVKEIADTLHTFLTATNDADNTINKWKELEAFLNGIPDSNSTLIGLMNNKVDKTTTVNGHALSGNITISKGDVGLGNVDNKSDMDKPVSTAQKAAIDLKLDKAGGSITNNLTVGKELQANLIKSTTDVIAYAGADASASGMIIDDLSDVNTSGKQNGYVLTYNGVTTKWEAKEVKAGGGLVEVSFSDIKGSPADNTALKTSLGTKVESATIGGTAVTKSGTQLQFPAYPTTLPASDVPVWAKASSLAVSSVPNLPSSKITAMTGYSKATTVSAISATDSLNIAVGKLEKALDGKQASGSYEPSFSKNNAFNKSFGTTSGTVCQGNDSRLSNSRPASDVHAWAKASSKPAYNFTEITGIIDCGTY
ncbi:MAG: hypothetical protein ACRCX4_06970 [Bacteroidales bacterium]